MDLEIFFNIVLALITVIVAGVVMGFCAYSYIVMFDLLLSYIGG